MGYLDDLVDTIEAPLKLASGVINGAKDTTSLVGNLIDGKYSEALDDGRNLMGDAGDLTEGLSGLGFSVGPLPSAFGSSKVLNPADSKVLAAAQLAIDGMKKTTGTGEPCNGDEFRGSSNHLLEAVDTLINAEPHKDRWDGTASQVYDAVNASHRRIASDVQSADLAVADVLDTEAGQVARTRKTLDDISQGLKDYDLATCWMNATGPGRILKFGLDCTAAGGALQGAGAVIGVLVKNSIENAARIHGHVGSYTTGAEDTSGNPMGGCDVFAIPENGEQALPRGDSHATPLPDPAGGTVPPSRSQPDTPYTVPGPEEPPVQAPATPYGIPAPR